MEKNYKLRESRAVGAILGGAIGDALGVTNEIFPRADSLDAIHNDVLLQRLHFDGVQTEIVGGGPWTDAGLFLEPGEWTDDTAMMLCVADSLIVKSDFDAGDLMSRFFDWYERGYNSCRAHAFGVGRVVKRALENFDRANPGNPAGGSDPARDAGNGSLMRLAPVPVFYNEDLERAISVARAQSACTHHVDECLDGCALMTFLLWNGINGSKREEAVGLLNRCSGLSHPAIRELTERADRWERLHSADIRTLPGRCVISLEAALWCFLTTESFEDALVRAVNLGGDSDTVGSITGQIAGSFYGREGIPERWIRTLKFRDEIEARAVALFQHGPWDGESMDLDRRKIPEA
jgi:ADP-ribosyl-[dinitrogen reductase] hydrolase